MNSVDQIGTNIGGVETHIGENSQNKSNQPAPRLVQSNLNFRSLSQSTSDRETQKADNVNSQNNTNRPIPRLIQSNLNFRNLPIINSKSTFDGGELQPTETTDNRISQNKTDQIASRLGQSNFIFRSHPIVNLDSTFDDREHHQVENSNDQFSKEKRSNSVQQFMEDLLYRYEHDAKPTFATSILNSRPQPQEPSANVLYGIESTGASQLPAQSRSSDRNLKPGVQQVRNTKIVILI